MGGVRFPVFTVAPNTLEATLTLRIDRPDVAQLDLGAPRFYKPTKNNLRLLSFPPPNPPKTPIPWQRRPPWKHAPAHDGGKLRGHRLRREEGPPPQPRSLAGTAVGRESDKNNAIYRDGGVERKKKKKTGHEGKWKAQRDIRRGGALSKSGRFLRKTCGVSEMRDGCVFYCMHVPLLKLVESTRVLCEEKPQILKIIQRFNIKMI